MDEPPSNIQLIYISNLSEDVWPFISDMSDNKARSLEIEENANLSDRDLFSLAGMDNIFVVLPHPADNEFVDYYRKLFGSRNVHVTTPSRHTGETCKDVLNDPKLLSTIKTIVAQNPKVGLSSYSTSPQFFELAAALRTINPNLSLPDSPELEESWTVNFYGSKSGFRQLSQQSLAEEPDFKMSEGMISSDIDNTAKIASNMYSHNGGIVLKTNKGHSGAGLLIFRPGDIPNDYPSCYQTIMKKLKEEAYWSKFPIVIEKYVDPSTIGGGFPNIEFKIAKNGRVNFLYYCGMRVTKQGVFNGVEINDSVLSDKVTAQIMDLGFFIGEQLASHGYRGYYDVDFIAAKNGQLYVTESNVRRTGGTHVYHTALALFGKDFLYDAYTLSNNAYSISQNANLRFSDLYQRFAPILYNHRTKEGLVITSANLLKQDKFGYVISAKTKSQALKIEAQMESLLSSS